MISRFIFLSLLVSSSIAHCALTELTTVKSYNDAFKASKPALFFFFGDHCGPCKIMKPHYAALAQDPAYADIAFYTVNSSSDALDSIMDDLHIQSIPTLICTWNGTVLLRHTGGLSLEALRKKIAEFRNKLKPAAAPKDASPKSATKKCHIRKKNLDVTL